MEVLEASHLLANVATFIGAPVAIAVFVFSVMSERRAREYGTYDALDNKYIDYLRLCAENPRLNLYYYPISEVLLSEEEKVSQWSLFEILVTLMERAYLMYSGQRGKMKREQWRGWESYCEYWARDPRFQNLWSFLGDQFDESFVRFMNKKVDAAKISSLE